MRWNAFRFGTVEKFHGIGNDTETENMTIISIPRDALFVKKGLGLSAMSGPSGLRREVETLSQLIAAIGLLNPLTVVKVKGRYEILDGTKRFLAIKKLARGNRLPRSLSKVPCIVTGQGASLTVSVEKPLLISDQDFVEGVSSMSRMGVSLEEVSRKYHCSIEAAQKALSLKGLHDSLKQAFRSGALNLEQAAAFATLPNPKSQKELLLQLGPFVSDKAIIAAISAGETVIETPGGNVLILPSRSPAKPGAENIERLKRAA